MAGEIVYSPNKGRQGGRGGQGGPFKMGPGGNCVCPKCGLTKPHLAGCSCTDELCPECASPLVREEVLKVIQSIMK